MPTIYEPVPEAVSDLVDKVITKRHEKLAERNVKLSILFASKVGSDGIMLPEPAVKVHGWPALAKIKINSYADRVDGKADATMTIDRNRWHTLSDKQQVALIDHELTHLIPTKDTDDCNRPILRMRPHDFECGGFLSIIEQHQNNAPETAQLMEIGKQVRPLLQGTFWG